MINKIKMTTKHSAIYSLGNITTKLVGLILLPLYTDKLSVDEYGILSILEVTAQIGTAIFAFQLQAAFLRWCSAKSSESDFKSIVFSVLSVFLLSSGLILLIFIPNADALSSLFFGSDKYSEYFVLLSITIGLSILNRHPLTLLRVKQKSVLYAGANIVKLVIMLGLNVYFVAFLGWGIKGILLGQIAGQTALQILTIGVVLKNISFKFYSPGFMEMLRFSFPLIFTGIASLLLNMGDRFLIKYFLDEASVGVYALGQKISSVLNMLLLQSFILGFQPIAYRMAEQPNSKRYFSKILTYFTFVLVFTALGLSVFSREFIRFVAGSKSYWDAFIFVPVLTLGFVFRGMSTNISIAFYIIKKTTYNAFIVIGGLTISLILNLILLPTIGVMGSALSMMISGFLMAGTAYLIGRKVYPVPFEIAKLFLMIAVGAGLYYLSALTNGLNLELRLLLKFLAVISFPFVLYTLNFYEKVELEYFRKGFGLLSSPSKLKEFVKNVKI